MSLSRYCMAFDSNRLVVLDDLPSLRVITDIEFIEDDDLLLLCSSDNLIELKVAG